MTTRTTKRMTAVEFEAVRPLLDNIAKERIEAARMVLVDGQSMPGVAVIFGWTRQAVYQCVGAVWAFFEKYNRSRRAEAIAQMELPPGWERVTLVAPSAMIAQFREQLAQVAVTMPALAPPPIPATVVKKARAAVAAKKKTRSA